MQRETPRPTTNRSVILLLVAALGITLVVSAGGSARARGGKGGVSRISKQALGHFLQGEFDQAAVLYWRAHRASGAPKYLYNIGLCYYKLGRYGPALKLLRRFQGEAGKTVAPAYVQGAAKKITEILRISRLVRLDVGPVGARIMLDWRPPVTAPLVGRIRLRNGKHTLLVTAGQLTLRRTFRVGPGYPDVVKVRLRPQTSSRRRAVDGARRRATPPGRRATGTVAPRQKSSRKGRVAWLAMAVTGAVLFAAGEGLAWGLWAAQDGGDKTSNKTLGYLYYTGHGLAAAGVALAVVGVVLYLRKPGPRGERAAGNQRIQWTPVVTAGPKGAYAGVGGTF